MCGAKKEEVSMSPAEFPQANTKFGPPPDLDGANVGSIRAFKGTINSGSLEGYPVVVVAWKPSEADMERLTNGGLVYLQMVGGGLAPHLLSTTFEEAVNPS
jgi:hypothetical protein